MRLVLILVVLVVAAIAVGWLTIGFTDTGANISVNADKARDDTSRVLDSTSDAIQDPLSGPRAADR